MSVILVVDQNSVYRSGLQVVIEERIEDSRVTVASAIESVDDCIGVDLMLIDAESLTQHSFNLLKQVHGRNPQTRFAVISNSNAPTDVLNCLSAGFHGFVYKWQSGDEMLRAVRDLLSGRIYVPHGLGDRNENMLANANLDDARTRQQKLTPRQTEILPLLARGMSNKAIARHLCIAEGTAKAHTVALMRALGMNNRTQAAVTAARLAGLSHGEGQPNGFRATVAVGMSGGLRTESSTRARRR